LCGATNTSRLRTIGYFKNNCVLAFGLAFALLSHVHRLRLQLRPIGRRNRGFTLVELMVVVVVITALTALAIPSILKQMRDRRTRQAAEEIAAIYRQARLRALGRGSAVLVRYANASFETREAMLGGATANCTQLPLSSCTSADWTGTNASLTSQQLSLWAPPAGINSDVFASGIPGTAQTAFDVCFTPMGRTYVNTATPPAFNTWSGVPLIRVSSAIDATRLKRYVLIPPNGLARTDVAQ
jgi:type IV fimbrial biogenesis protein FimT